MFCTTVSSTHSPFFSPGPQLIDTPFKFCFWGMMLHHLLFPQLAFPDPFPDDFHTKLFYFPFLFFFWPILPPLVPNVTVLQIVSLLIFPHAFGPHVLARFDPPFACNDKLPFHSDSHPYFLTRRALDFFLSVSFSRTFYRYSLVTLDLLVP